MLISKNKDIKKYNTFGIKAKARYFIEIKQKEDFEEFCLDSYLKNLERVIISGGSNVLFTKDFEGVFLKIAIKGVEVLEETNDFITLRVGAGENWNDFVDYCVKNNWAGVENLTLIPGSVGAAPTQNIGAYGVEIKDILVEVEIFNFLDCSYSILKNSDCMFEYRSSIFKQKIFIDNVVITSVTMKLTKPKKYKLQTDYNQIKERLDKFNKPHTILEVQKVINQIRKEKIPDWHILGNAGSFFKNPYISKSKYDEINKKYTISYHGINPRNGYLKISAAGLISLLGLKGYGIKDKDASIDRNNPLVIINHGNATGRDILELSEYIKSKVLKEFSIQLENEVRII